MVGLHLSYNKRNNYGNDNGMSRVENENNNESIQKWFNEEIGEGENGIVVYPNLQSFRQIYTQFVKEQLEKADELLMPRIILIATFYETIDSIKHHLSAVGVQNVQSLIDNGSLLIIDSFSSYYPHIDGMKKLVATLSDRARKEGRDGVTAIVDMGFFFLFGGDSKAADLISYEASLAPKTQDGNVKGISCYHWGNYETLTERDKELLTQGQKKKLLEVREIRNHS
jgi:MEDS: MEthanogen/methylotroph, DcmR Sensory domain